MRSAYAKASAIAHRRRAPRGTSVNATAITHTANAADPAACPEGNPNPDAPVRIAVAGRDRPTPDLRTITATPVSNGARTHVSPSRRSRPNFQLSTARTVAATATTSAEPACVANLQIVNQVLSRGARN